MADTNDERPCWAHAQKSPLPGRQRAHSKAWRFYLAAEAAAATFLAFLAVCFLATCFFAAALGLEAAVLRAGAAAGAGATAGTDVAAGLTVAGAWANDITAAVESKAVATRVLMLNMMNITPKATVAAAPTV